MVVFWLAAAAVLAGHKIELIYFGTKAICQVAPLHIGGKYKITLGARLLDPLADAASLAARREVGRRQKRSGDKSDLHTRTQANGRNSDGAEF